MHARIEYSKVDPDARKALLALETYLDAHGLEPLLMELVRIRASQINGCAYCLDMHIKDARALGESEQRIYLLSAWRESPFYSERERAALEYAEAVTLLSAGGVPDEVYTRVQAQFDEAEIVRLTMLVVAINTWNRMNVSLRIPVGNYQSRRRPVVTAERA